MTIRRRRRWLRADRSPAMPVLPSLPPDASTDRPPDQPSSDQPMLLRRRDFTRYVRINLAVVIAIAVAAGAAAIIVAFGRISVLEDDLAQRRKARADIDKQTAALFEQYRRTICTLARHADDPHAPDIKQLRAEFECEAR